MGRADDMGSFFVDYPYAMNVFVCPASFSTDISTIEYQ